MDGFCMQDPRPSGALHKKTVTIDYWRLRDARARAVRNVLEMYT